MEPVKVPRKKEMVCEGQQALGELVLSLTLSCEVPKYIELNAFNNLAMRWMDGWMDGYFPA
jgi:hypothetical protein